MLTVYGIETHELQTSRAQTQIPVATVLTVYGIETQLHAHRQYRMEYQRLQQLLPFTVLKLFLLFIENFMFYKLQQLLPFTVLKLEDCVFR